jgi:hypothetical protein
MKLWGNEYHLMLVTSATLVYYNESVYCDMKRVKWRGNLYGINKIVTFNEESWEGTYKVKGNVYFEKFLVVEVTSRLFTKSYKILGPVRNFYMFLPKNEQEASRKLWDKKIIL